MKYRFTFGSLLLPALYLVLSPNALANSKWYVDGVQGSDNNNCKSRQHACKTIGHAISLAHSGDSVMVAPATYTENLNIGISLNVIGASPKMTIIDGGRNGTVVTVSSPNEHVRLSKLTIVGGATRNPGGGIYNNGTLTLSDSTLSGNFATYSGGGIYNSGTLKITNSVLNSNSTGFCKFGRCAGAGGGILNDVGGTLTIKNCTLSGNVAYAYGGGISNSATLTIDNSTLSGNVAGSYLSVGIGGGIYNSGTLTISSSTISSNSGLGGGVGGGIANLANSGPTLKDSIVASNLGGNCYGAMTSNGYNLSSDGSCHFNNTGDLNNTDPKLGTLGNYGGPTQTVPLLAGSPAIDAGNPSGCTDGNGHLLKTDQRGRPRPDKEDTGGCDMGAYERQSD